MDRREALRRVALLLGSVAVAPEIIASALANPLENLRGVPAERMALLAELADTIIPDTPDSPGAKAAKTEEFIALAVEKCLPIGHRKRFWDALTSVDETCLRESGRSFTAFSPTERIAFLKKMEAESKAVPADPDNPSFFFALKSLTLYGYFTSEIGATQALNYDPVPGQWIADMKIDANAKAWASVF